MLSLKPLSEGKRQRDLEEGSYAVFDIEARNWIRHVVNGYFDGTEFRYFKSIAKFLDALEEMEKPPKHIFSHFGGGYDFLFLFDEILKTARGDIENIIARGGNILFFDYVWIDGQGEERKVTFRDSSAIFPFGLKKLADDFRVKNKKGEINYAKIRKITPELLAYLESDCRALFECLSSYFDTPLIRRAGPAFTSASQAMRIFRLYLRAPLYSSTREADSFIRRGYFGGRVEIFRPYFGPRAGSKQKLLHVFDVNSLYPSIMRDNEFPTQEGEFTRRRKKGTLYFADVTVSVPPMYVPPLPFLCPKRKKLIFPTGKFRGIYSSVELEYAESLGVEVLKVHRVLKMKRASPIFRKFITELYKIREKNPRGSVLNYLAKTAMNSLYGRMGLNLDKEELKIMGSIQDWATMDEYRRYNFGKREVKILRGRKILKSFSNVGIAAWVTSLARIKMHEYLLAHEKEIYYIDTDSLFTTKKIPSSEKLGEMKHEYSVKEACFILPKTYAVRFQEMIKGKKKKLVMKGFENKKLHKIPFAAFYEALQGDLQRLKITTTPTHLKFRSALKKKKFLVLGKKSVKSIKSKYDKREIIPARKILMDTRPWEIQGEDSGKRNEAEKTIHAREKDGRRDRNAAPRRQGGKNHAGDFSQSGAAPQKRRYARGRRL
jgi:hypothetical protein